MTGVLVMEGECIRLRSTVQSYYIIWPEGSRLPASAPPVVTDASGKSRTVGARVILQGGEIAADSYPPGSFNRSRMDACGGPFFVTSGFLEALP